MKHEEYMNCISIEFWRYILLAFPNAHFDAFSIAHASTFPTPIMSTRYEIILLRSEGDHFRRVFSSAASVVVCTRDLCATGVVWRRKKFLGNNDTKMPPRFPRGRWCQKSSRWFLGTKIPRHEGHGSLASLWPRPNIVEFLRRPTATTRVFIPLPQWPTSDKDDDFMREKCIPAGH